MQESKLLLKSMVGQMLINIEQFFIICWLFISRKKAFTINKIIKVKSVHQERFL
jgi:hypothetical protein